MERDLLSWYIINFIFWILIKYWFESLDKSSPYLKWEKSYKQGQ